MNVPHPYLTGQDELRRVLDISAAPDAHVVVTLPHGKQVSVGDALRAALSGPTRALTMLVGYFSDGQSVDAPEDSPLGLLRSEAADELTRAWEDPDPRDNAGFRLLFGALAGNAAGTQLALRTYWALATWRLADPQGAEAWREALLHAWSSAPGAGVDAGTRYARFAHGAFGLVPGSSAPLCPWLAQPPDPQAPQSLAGLRAAWEHAVDETRTAAELVVLFVVRRAHLRAQAANLAGLFHGKLYVVERAVVEGATTVARDTVALMGSPNWSQGAIFGRGAHANVEVAAISRAAGWPWSSADPPTELTARLAQTARTLFYDPQATALIAAWHDDLAPPAWDELDALLREAQERGQSLAPASETRMAPRAEAVQTLAPALHPVARALLQLIDTVLQVHREDTGFGARTLLETHLHQPRDVVGGKPSAQRFAGKQIHAAQSDGAVRLLGLLRESPAAADGWAGRGAFLADEAGLGKSVVAQMVAFALWLAKALDLRRDDSALPRMTILAPRQLVASEVGSGKDAGQWPRHRLEILDELLLAVGATLQDPATPPDVGARAQQVQAQLLAERAGTASDNVLRVFPLSTFQRNLQQGRNQQLVEDLAHIAASEVVVIDESHNLRNGGSSRTRLARLLLTLPAPGETWPVFAEDGKQTTLVSGAASPPAGGDPYARRVLCLTATPFNNAFDDLVTQIGHFGRAQSWTRVQATPTLPGVDAAHPDTWLTAIDVWRQPGARTKQHLAAFATLLRLVSEPPAQDGSKRRGSTKAVGHLRGGRRLDPDPARAEHAHNAGQVIRDGGPAYVWPAERYKNLNHDLPLIHNALERLANDATDAGPDATHDTEHHEAVTRLDALLGRLVVQRSRARVIQLMPRRDREAQFRAPDLPRVPLPLNRDDNRGTSNQDAEILGRLFSQLGVEGTDGLSLFAYRISTLRAQVGAAGSGEQKVSNLLGFQRMQLIKRLQSSRYAFLQTLLRGPLLRTLVELALVEQLLDGDLPVPPQVSADLPPNWEARARQTINDALLHLASCQQHNKTFGLLMESITNTTPGAGARLRDWLLPADRPAAELVEKFVGKAGQQQIDELQNPHAKPESWVWLAALLGDVQLATPETSQLRADVQTILEWAFTDRQMGLGATIPLQIVGDRPRRGEEHGVLGHLWRDLSGSLQHEGHADQLREWARLQLKTPQLRGVVGWLLAQTSARQQHITIAAGYRSLLFSEYTDTLDYLASVLQVLRACAAYDLGVLADEGELADTDLAEALAKAVAVTLSGLRDQAAPLVARAAPPTEAGGEGESGDPPASYAYPMALLEDLRAGRSDVEWHEHLLRQAVALCSFTGLRTGSTARRLLAPLADGDDVVAPAPATAQDDFDALDPDTLHDGRELADDDLDNDVDQEDRLASVGDTRAGDALVDAFAPWYRVDPVTLGLHDNAPTDGQRLAAKAALARLRAGAEQPLFALLTTEVLAEGVNLQECGVVIHLDLPWNPTRLIQRNGRVDRRIQPRYEHSDGRALILQQLARWAGDATPPVLPPPAPPRQVYHLTVVPPEPDLQDPGLTARVAAVRNTLYRKLRNIQLLFGLSSWPIVLRAEEAKAVLTGELEIETPGFRRREELFARRLDLLRHVAKDAPPVQGHIALRVPRAVFASVFVPRLAGPRPGPRWDDVQALGVQAWSPRSDSAHRVLRTGAVWSNPVPPQPWALTSWALRTTAQESALLRWGTRRFKSAVTERFAIVPTLLTVMPDPKRPDQNAVAAYQLQADPRTFDVSTLGSRDGVRQLPATPADGAEELLDAAVTYLLTLRGAAHDEAAVAIDAGAPVGDPSGTAGEQVRTALVTLAWESLGQAVVAGDGDPPPRLYLANNAPPSTSPPSDEAVNLLIQCRAT